MYPEHHIVKPEPRRADTRWGAAFFTHFLQHLSSCLVASGRNTEFESIKDISAQEASQSLPA